jgi:hypothetical protein
LTIALPSFQASALSPERVGSTPPFHRLDHAPVIESGNLIGDRAPWVRIQIVVAAAELDAVGEFVHIGAVRVRGILDAERIPRGLFRVCIHGAIVRLRLAHGMPFPDMRTGRKN